MNILVIMGSPHKGETLAVLKKLTAYLQAQGPVQIEMLWLKDIPWQMCRGCHACIRFGEQKCPLHDGAETIEAKMLAADGIILATPVYSQQVSYLMKIFFDRFAYWWHRPRFFHQVVLPVASGGGQFRSTLAYMAECATAWGAIVLPGLGAPHLDSLVPKASARLEREIARSANHFYQAVQAQQQPGAQPPAPSLFRVIWFRMWRINARACRDYNPTDFAWWQGHGWLENDFYTAQPIPFFQRWAGRLVEPLLRKMLRSMYRGYEDAR